MRVGVVITTCEGREENLKRVLACLERQTHQIETVSIVYDGIPVPVYESLPDRWINVRVSIPKHAPGQEQPRNVGLRQILGLDVEIDAVWFLDSDLIFEPDCLQRFRDAWDLAGPRVLIGPYEWLAPGVTVMDKGLFNDIRWASFRENGPEVVKTHCLGTSLACFSGNLLWPIDDFQRVGGFHPQLHHGRCEDGELGLRAGSAGIPMSLVRDARAWHVAHQIGAGALEKNARDVPLLNSWHPWVQEQGLLLTEADGARFDFACPDCNLVMNSADYWNHVESHRIGVAAEYADPASVRSIV